MDLVVLVHPDLPGRELTVPAVGVHHYERSGWQRKSADEPSTGPVGPDETEGE